MMLPTLAHLLRFLGFSETRSITGAIAETRDHPPQPVVVPARHPGGHTLITGATGHGASLAVRHILDNQIASGGGLVVIDAVADDAQRKRVGQYAESVGRAADVMLLGDTHPKFSKAGLEIPEIDFAEVIARNKIVYITLPSMGKSAHVVAMGQQLLARLEADLPNMPHHASPGCLVALLNGLCDLAEDPTALLTAAREQNVTMLVRETYTGLFGEVDNPLAQALRDQMWTKLCFREHGFPQATHIANLVNGSLSRPHPVVTPYHLHTLTMGEFLLVQGDALSHAKLYPTKTY